MSSVFYMDTNVFGHLFDLTAGVTKESREEFQRLIREAILTVPVSLTVLDEMIVLFRCNPKRAVEQLRLFADLCSFDHILKPPGQILTESIEAFLFDKSPQSVFFPETSHEAVLIKNFFSGGIVPAELEPIAQEVNLGKEDFFEKMSRANRNVREDLGIKENKKLPRFEEGRPTFEEYLQLVGPGICEEMLNRGERTSGNDPRLFEVRAVRAFAGIACSWSYSQTFENRKLRSTDGIDQRHLVQASMTDGLITHDKEFRRLINRVALPDFTALTLDELVLWLGVPNPTTPAQLERTGTDQA